MGWIKDRIDAEYRKHPDLDWSLLAEKKIMLVLEDQDKNKSKDEKEK